MDLAKTTKRQATCIKGGLEAPAVFEDVFFGVPLGETKIQDHLTVEFAHASGPRAESVQQPRDSC